MNRRIFKHVAVAALLLTLVALIACGDAGQTSKSVDPGTPNSIAAYPYTFKFYVDDGASKKLVNVVPTEVAVALRKASRAAPAHKSQTQALSTTFGLHPLDISVPVTGSSQPFVVTGTDDLLHAAAAECGMIGDDPALTGNSPRIMDDPLLQNDPALQDIVSQERNFQRTPAMWFVPPWDYNIVEFPIYYIFSNPPMSCDAVLEDEETLLCMADKLSELADAVGPVTWHAARFLPSGGANGVPPNQTPPVSWIIPPQAEKDKFIVRDLAIDVLAHVPMLDSYSWAGTNPDGRTTCSNLYSQYYATPSAQLADVETTLFGQSPIPGHTYPPIPTTPTRNIIQERQAFEAGVLRGAGQLLHDLVRESVYNDLAGAAAKGGRTADQTGGQVLAAGLNPTAPYNSLAHVARMLLGRWDVASPTTSLIQQDPEQDPACHQVAELDLLPKLADPGMRSRAADLGALTSTQALAETLFEEAGLVIADNATTDLGAALLTQLVALKAAAANVDVTTFGTQPGGVALANLVATLGVSDLTRAAQHNRTTFSILTNSPTNDPTALPGAATQAGLTLSTLPNPLVAGAGIAISGGLARGLATTDPVARSGPMMAGSQCREVGYFALPSVQFSDFVALAPKPASNQDLTYSGPFAGGAMRQDVFAVASGIRSRLVKLREHADGSNPTDSSSTPDAQARAAAVAELGAWAGAGRAILSTSIGDGNSDAAPGTLYLDLAGVIPADFGVQQASDIQSRISLVYNDPHLAECAAHLTTISCDPTAVQNATWNPTPDPQSVDTTDPHYLARTYGSTDSKVRVSFNVAGAAGLSAPVNLQNLINTELKSGFGFENPFYIVLSQDPTKADGVGAVLGALALPTNAGLSYNEAALTLSPMRRELLYDAFGLGRWVGAAPPQAGERPSSGPPSFCVEGVSRDLFVPLQNDLTDNSQSYENSWQHYLSLAQEAATNADNLGQQLVDIGFQKDTTIENAAEQLLAETGVLPNVDNMKIDANGNISAGPLNGALNSILNQSTVDAVFFGTGPANTPNKDVADRPTLLNALGCDQYPDNPLCGRAGDPNNVIVHVQLANIVSWAGPSGPNVFTYTALNLPPPPSPQVTASRCSDAVAGSLAMKGVTQTSAGATYQSGTKFSAGAFANGVQNLDAGQVAGAMGSVKMTLDDVGNPGHWQVSYGDTAFMDSDAPALWPGCLTQTDPVKACDFAHSTLNADLNDMFRWCDSTLDMRAAHLGDCDGGKDQELNAIRWRIEGALWLAAAMSGDIHKGMFNAPMPAVNFPSVSDPGKINAPFNIFFSNGTFATAGFGNQVQGFSNTYGSVPPNQNSVLGAAVAVDPASRYFHWGSEGVQQVPLWLLTIYSPGDAQRRNAGALPYNTGDAPATPNGPPYVHIAASNPDGPSDYSNLIPFFDKLGISGSSSTAIPPQSWRSIVNLFNGKQCAQPLTDGTIANASFGDGWLQGLVASMKTEQSPSSDMRNWVDNENGALAFDWNGSAFEMTRLDPRSSFTPRSKWFDQVPVHFATIYTPTQPGTCLPVNRFGQCEGEIDYLAPINMQWINRFPDRVRDQRLYLSLNSKAPNGNCDAAWQLTQAMAMSCLLTQDIPNHLPAQSTKPTQLTKVSDLVGLSSWLQGRLAASQQLLQSAYVAHVPAVVIANARNVPGTLTSGAGTVGKDLVQTSNSLLAVYTDWTNIQTDAQSISNAIASTTSAIALANDDKNAKDISNYIAKLGAMKDVALDTAQMVGGIFSAVTGLAKLVKLDASGVIGGVENAVSGGLALSFDSQLLPQISNLSDNAAQTLTDQINADIGNLNQQVTNTGAALSNAMITLRMDVNNISAGAGALSADRATAAYYAGKALGADVWNCGQNGQVVECGSHVNTVLDRRYDGTNIRYQRALQDAKGLGYIARLAIEQRLGIRLNEITAPVGTLPAPSTWADDVCHLSGVNYKTLRTEIGLDAGSQATVENQALAAQFADAFIGDYVQKLTDFVQFYNVTYPEQDGNDTAVLSVRESLMGGTPACKQPSTNQIVDSSRLYSIQSAPSQSTTGWTRTSCSASDANCLDVRSLALQAPSIPGGASWLSDQPRPALDANGVDPINSAAIAGGPDNVETQEVLINAPGKYILSWWDQSLDPSSGQPVAPPTPLPPYQAGVYDSAWTPVAGFSGPAAPSSDPTGAGWSGRHALTFAVAKPDVFHVVFGASVAGGAPGSVGIANVQLELATSSGVPSAYVDTDISGQMTAFNCAVSPAGFRAAFTHRCDPDGTCHYDLDTPIAISTQTMTSNGMSLTGKLATGNFNFRHIDVGVNMVGTGVADCTGTGSQDCFGSGFQQYTLTDDGTSSGVLGFDKQYRNFDFGIATIEHGKALAAERYLTTPLGTNDQQLVEQVLQPQLRGRPLDGVYRLSIYDSPALRFDQLQDIQIVLKYHYWSRVTTSNNAN